MDIDFTEINYLKDPQWQEIQADYEQFLMLMTGPTVIDISGKDNSKYRVVTTLLHGNEPSGLIALHRWLTAREDNEQPQTNLRFIICSVEAASIRPLFSARFPEGGVDINRCFGQSNANKASKSEHQGYYQRALLIEQAIREVSPEMVIDLHNGSSPGPTFSISPIVTTETLSIASFFCQTLILSNLQLGALMEQDFNCNFITIECGGCHDEQAHEIAYAGIGHVASCKHIDYIHQEKCVEVIYRPLRLQVKPGIRLSYAEHDEGFSGVTLKSNIEYFNFGSAHQDEMLGWLDGNGLDNLQLMDNNNENVIDEYFFARENQLVCRQNLRIFKATTNKKVALNDCLFYVVKVTKAENH